MPTDAPTSPTIEEIFTAFLDEQRARLAPRTFANYETIIELFADCLNGYGHQSLDDDERERWEAAYDAGDEDAFVHLFGTDKIITNLGEFLGYFMVRKVMAGQELLKAAGTVKNKLSKYLAAQGLIDADDAAIASDRASDATRDLPNADKLGSLLYEQTMMARHIDVDDVPDDDWVEDSLFIDRVEGKTIWFEGGIGPLEVAPEAAKLAQPGWQVTVTLGRYKGKWHLLEVGNVYP